MYDKLSLLSVIAIYSLILFMSFTYVPKVKQNILSKEIYIFISFSLFLIIIFRDRAHLYDQLGYEKYFYTYIKNGKVGLSEIVSVEPSFLLFANIVKYLFNSKVFVLFVLYTVTGFTIKNYIIFNNDAVNGYEYLSLLLYCSFYLFLHDFIQIRVATALSFFFLAIQYRDKNRKKCILFLLISVLFHYQAIFGFIILFINSKDFNKPLYIFLFFFALGFAFLRINIFGILSKLNLGVFSLKLSMYQNSDFENINPFSLSKIVRYFFLFIIFITSKELFKNKQMIFYSKLYFYSIFFQLLFSSIPVVPTRISEYFRISEVFLFPNFVNCFKEKDIVKMVLIMYCIYLFLFSLKSYLFSY